tara:strand:- start:6577 stop:7137 length:561 start_codon:yes stop_codon:yes gene_type:complete
MCTTGDISNGQPSLVGTGVPDVKNSAETRETLGNQTLFKFYQFCLSEGAFFYRRGKPQSNCESWFLVAPDPRSVDADKSGQLNQLVLKSPAKQIDPPVALDAETCVDSGLITEQTLNALLFSQRSKSDRDQAREDYLRNQDFLDQTDAQYRANRPSLFSLPDIPAPAKEALTAFFVLLAAVLLFRR